jgi:uncharacterized protein (DUF1330 family)
LSRSLLGFLVFCLLLVLASAGVVWYMGPALAAIVVDEARRENPYYLLQLLPAATASAGEGAPSFRARFVNLAADDDARLLWQGGEVNVAEGSVLLDVAGVQLIEFTTGAELVQMLTSSAYRDLESDFADAPTHHLGSSGPPDALAADAATVVVLYRAESPAAGAPLGVPGERGWLALLPHYQGAVRWDASIGSVRGGGVWNGVLLVQFPDAATAQAWLTDPNTATERAIARKQVADMVVLVVQPSAFTPR